MPKDKASTISFNCSSKFKEPPNYFNQSLYIAIVLNLCFLQLANFLLKWFLNDTNQKKRQEGTKSNMSFISAWVMTRSTINQNNGNRLCRLQTHGHDAEIWYVSFSRDSRFSISMSLNTLFGIVFCHYRKV